MFSFVYCNISYKLAVILCNNKEIPMFRAVNLMKYIISQNLTSTGVSNGFKTYH